MYRELIRTSFRSIKENLIALSGGIQGEISNLLLNVGEKQAEDALRLVAQPIW